nr:aldehyde dehydrogenase family protein [Klebsiella pneumoniae subsp. pneumoniae]
MINGKNVAGADYFHTTNPATGEVLAEVASGGEAEINQAVAAAKEAFPKWANLPMKERARLMRRLGILSIRTSRRSRRWKPPIPACRSTRPKRVDPARLTQFRIFRRSVPADERQDLSGRRQDAELHLVQPVGVCALVSPWNVPFMTATWKVAPCWRWGIPRC